MKGTAGHIRWAEVSKVNKVPGLAKINSSWTRCRNIYHKEALQSASSDMTWAVLEVLIDLKLPWWFSMRAGFFFFQKLKINQLQLIYELPRVLKLADSKRWPFLSY